MAKISAGSYDLNKWLFGGYENDVVTVIYGGPGSGKTNFCMLAAVSQAKKGNKVVFVDTEGGFSSERVKQLVNGDLDVNNVLKNIFLLKPTNFNEQKDAFKKLNEFLKDEISLIIVDGMTILYRLDFAAAREKDDNSYRKINAELVSQMKTLAEIARKKNIPVIVTNQSYKWEDERRMVGGDILNYWGKCIIELVNDKSSRIAYLRKHRSLKEKEMEFKISDTGIKRTGWI